MGRFTNLQRFAEEVLDSRNKEIEELGLKFGLLRDMTVSEKFECGKSLGCNGCEEKDVCLVQTIRDSPLEEDGAILCGCDNCQHSFLEYPGNPSECPYCKAPFDWEMWDCEGTIIPVPDFNVPKSEGNGSDKI